MMIALGCADPAPVAERMRVPEAENEAAAGATFPIDLEMATGLAYRMSFATAGEGPFRSFSDELVYLERGEDGARVIRGRCGVFSAMQDEGCVPFLFPEGRAVGVDATPVEWRWSESSGLRLRGTVRVDAPAEPAVVVHADRQYRWGQLMAGTIISTGRFLVDERRYAEVTHQVELFVHPLDPTGYAQPATYSGTLTLRYDAEATDAARAASVER